MPNAYSRQAWRYVYGPPDLMPSFRSVREAVAADGIARARAAIPVAQPDAWFPADRRLAFVRINGAVALVAWAVTLAAWAPHDRAADARELIGGVLACGAAGALALLAEQGEGERGEFAVIQAALSLTGTENSANAQGVYLYPEQEWWAS